MKLNKKFLSLVMALLMIVSALHTVSLAVNESYVFQIDSVTTVAGSIVDVPVRVKNNAGLQGFLIVMNYDKDSMKPIDVKCGDAFSSGSIETNLKKLTPGELRTVGYSGIENSADGILFTVTFEIFDVAAGQSEISLSYDSSNTYDADLNDVLAECFGGDVFINGASSSQTTVFFDSVNAVCGETIEIPIKIKNMSNTETLSFVMIYDVDAVEYVSTDSDKASFSENADNGIVSFTLSELKTVFNNGTLLTVKLKIKAVGNIPIVLESQMTQIACKGGFITAQENLATKPTFFAGNVTGTVNEKVRVSVVLKNNPGIMGFRVNLKYDANAIKPVPGSVIACDVIKGKGSLSDNVLRKADSGVVGFLWNGSGEVKTNGELFSVEFELLQSGKHTIEIEYSKPDTFNEEWEEITFECSDLTVFSECEKWLLTNNSDVTIDYCDNIIYGILPETESVSKYIKPIAGCTMKTEAQKGDYIGNKTVVAVYSSGEKVAEYTIVIFGDADGNGMCDGQDAVIVSCIIANMFSDSQINVAILLSADCNRDGIVDYRDVELLSRVGVCFDTIDQKM